ncbi:MAG: hypothetical protein ACOCZ8_03390 [Bacteroidota bacterium]
MRLRLLTASLFVGLLSLSACEVFNPDEQLPAYLALHYPELVQPNGDTITTAGVDNIWLFQGGNLHGIFPVQPDAPTVIPTTDLETTDFTLAGGVYLAGNPAQSVQYPFWEADTAFRTLTERDTVHFYPQFAYRADTLLDYHLAESFESGNQLEAFPDDRGGNNEVAYQVRAGSAFEGDRYLEVRFSESNRVMELYNPDAFFLPRTGRVFAEIAYRGNIKFGLSLIRWEAGSGPDEIIYVPFRSFATGSIPTRPYDTDAWQKVYYDLSVLIDQSPVNSPHHLYLLAISNGTPRNLQFDSVRILSFE